MSADNSGALQVAVLDLIATGTNTTPALHRSLSCGWRRANLILQELRSAGRIRFDAKTGIWTISEAQS